MTVDDIVTVRIGEGSAIRPDWAPGDASPDWSESEYRAFASADGRLFGGGWEGSGGSLRLDPHPYDEICVMTEGRDALVDTTGARREFAAGDVFFVPRGFRGTWETIEPSKKYFITYGAPCPFAHPRRLSSEGRRGGRPARTARPPQSDSAHSRSWVKSCSRRPHLGCTRSRRAGAQ
jgi:uncharacterized protein